MTSSPARPGLAFRHARAVLGVLLGLLLCAAVTGRALAQDARSEASAHFQRGVTLYHEGAYAAALVELQRAYALRPDYRVLYNVGQTASMLGDFVLAAQSFQRYLDKGGPYVDEARRREVEADIARFADRIATLSITVNEAGAALYVDGEPVGTSPMRGTLAVSAGRHRITAEGDLGARDVAVVDVAGRDFCEVSLRVSPLPRAVEVSAAQPPERATMAADAVHAPADDLASRQRWGAGLVATGGALAMAAGVVGLGFSLDARERYEHARASAVAPEEIATARAEFRRTSLLASSLAGGALALGVTGAVLLSRGEAGAESGERRQVAVGVSGQGLAVRGEF